MFVGAAIDMPLSQRDTLVLATGVQEFTETNERLHLRGTYVHVVKEDWGVSAQLRDRYFRSTESGEFDYFSPPSYAEVSRSFRCGVSRTCGGFSWPAGTARSTQSAKSGVQPGTPNTGQQSAESPPAAQGERRL